MQRNTLLSFLAGLFVLSLMQACKYKTDYQVPLDYNIYNNDNRVTASFYGIVLDEAGAPVRKAQVSLGTNYTQTDSNGVFMFTLVNTPSKNTTIRVAKEDYVTGFRSMTVEANTYNEARFTLLSKSAMQSFVSSAGGALQFGNQLTLQFPAKAVMLEANGLPYEGEVYVYARTINANTDAGKLSMPGDLRSIKANMAEHAAYSFGQFHVSMYDEAGNALALAPKNEVIVYCTVNNNQIASAPSSITLSRYDEVLGIWREKTIAMLQGNRYMGAITEMGYHQVHINDDAVSIKVKLLDANNLPLPGFIVKWANTVRKDNRMVLSNSTGNVNAMVPTNSALEMQVYSPNYSCGTTPIYTQTVATGGLPIDLGTIIVNTSLVNYVGVNGKLIDCSNDAVDYGFVLASPLNVFIPTNASGSFNFNFPCGGPSVPITFYGYNAGNRQVSATAPVILNSGMTNSLGNLFACNNVTPFIDITLTNMVTLATANKTFMASNDTVRASTNFANGESNITGFNGSNFVSITGIDTVKGTVNVNAASFDGIGNFPDNQFVFVSGTVTYTSYPFFPGHAIGQFNLYFTGLPSNNSYIATGNFRAPRIN
jgi:hypothetical protein